MRFVTALKVRCATVEELNETYKAKDVREELEELQLKFVNWLEWVLDHLFIDMEGWDGNLQAIVANEAVSEVTLQVGEHTVKFTKVYNIK